MLHGVPRARNTEKSPEQIQVELQKQEEKKVAYIKLCDAVLAIKKEGTYPVAALEATEKLLWVNPDVATAYNVRKKTLSKQGLDNFEKELELSERLLAKSPKNYSCWEYRKWVILQKRVPPFATELGLVELVLSVDARNFHAWDYRSFILGLGRAKGSSDASLEKDLAFTKKFIKASLSNYSAWHHRSRALEQYLSEHRDGAEFDSVIASERDLVTTALWTDSADQSPWLYHRWLTSKYLSDAQVRQELENIQELYEELGVDDPATKYVILTILFCERKLGLPVSKALVDRLITMDPDRRNYYMYLGETVA